MSGHDDRSTGYWVHQIWHSLQSAINTLGNSLNVTLQGTSDINIAQIGGATLPTPDPVALPVSIEWFGDSVGDVFGRLKVAAPETIFDSKQIAQDVVPVLWDDAATSGAGTSTAYSANRASTTIGVGNLTAGTRVRQTYEWHNYQPGKAQEVTMTGVIGAPTAGITRRWGQFNTQNGLFFELNSVGVRVCRRTNVTGTPTPNYSGYLNLTLSNGVTIDPSKANIWFIAYEWLGVGDVVFGVFYGQRPHILAIIENTNNLTSVYMSTPNLPLRYEISNDGTGPAATLETICTTVVSNGGRQDLGLPRAVDRDATPLTTLNDSDLYPLIAVRLRAGYEGATIVPVTASIMCTSTAAYQWKLLLNPTITGTALSFTAVPNSSIEADVSRTSGTKVTAGTGLLLASSYGQQSATSESPQTFGLYDRVRLGVSIAGTYDVLVLAVRRITGTTESFYGSFNYGESI